MSMSDSSFMLMFLLVPVLIAGRWILLYRTSDQLFWGGLALGAFVLFVVWMVVELREGAALP